MARISTRRLWRKADIEAYGAGKREYQTKEEGELQGEILDVPALSVRLKLTPGQVRKRLFDRNWRQIPEPDSSFRGRYHWWHRDQVEKWEKERDASEASGG